ncbi:MAG: hypothetical protein WBD07_09170 [Vicinamibacterales bacterium]
MRIGRRFVAAAGVLWLGALASQCSSPPTQPPGVQLIGGDNNMKPIFSVKELMAGMIDPISDNIFDAVHWDITAKGTVYTRPQTDADWEKVRIGAVSLAEGIYLLKVPRRWTPPGDVNNSTGPNPPELSPTQIQALVDKDPVLWHAKIEALRNVALEVLEIVKNKDVDELFAAGEDLDKACESCHLEYWYPGDRKLVDEDARQKARFERDEKKK